MNPATLTPLAALCPLLAALLSAISFALRRFHIAHDFRDGPISIIIGTGLILGFFALWAILVGGDVPALDAARALALLDSAAGLGAALTWIYMELQDRRELRAARAAEEQEAPHA